MKIFLLQLALLMVIKAPVWGAEYKAGETVEKDLFVGSREVRIEGEVTGGVIALGERLDPEKFFRIHRSTIVNLNYVKSL